MEHVTKQLEPQKTTIDSNTIYLGICMAGAVSAGAYTAGVMDYLLEALGEWDKRKAANAKAENNGKPQEYPDVPTHNVVIPIIGGASAGGMTAIITAAAVHNKIEPVGNINKEGDELLEPVESNKFYNAWVDLTDVEMFPIMLNTSDIDNNNGEVKSLLNSDFIDIIANKQAKIDKEKALPVLPRYIHPQLKVFTTLTNLEGFNYTIKQKANISDGKYYMSIHNDYACFMLNDPDYTNKKGWMPLDFKKDINTTIARDAAMATGAFPIGLSSRKLTREAKYINDSELYDGAYLKNNPLPDGLVETLNVDGGLINNEPFERVIDLLKDFENGYQQDDYATFNTSMLMIDPFPSEAPEKFYPSQNIFKVAGNTFGAMVQQMRAKPPQIEKALDAFDPSKWLIAPSRIRPNVHGFDEKVEGAKAIACGAFDGFSGFINKEFRIHDFYLGRFNCEMFLRNYFTIPAEKIKQNPVFLNGYAGIANTEKFRNKNGDYQIIPIFNPSNNDRLPMPKFSSGGNWPLLKSEAEVDKYYDAMLRRFKKITFSSLTKLNYLEELLMQIGWFIVIGKKVTDAAATFIKKSLKEHQLLK